MCTSTRETECDFSSLSKYGDHTLRVRAELADQHSDWVNITFCPVDDSKSLCFLFRRSATLMPWVARWLAHQQECFECPKCMASYKEPREPVVKRIVAFQKFMGETGKGGHKVSKIIKYEFKNLMPSG